MKNNILFISATHGDEGYSVNVLNELENKYSKRIYGYTRIIGNPKAFRKKIRYLDSNLNRSAPGNINSKLYEERRAYEIMKITKKYKYVIDLHGADSKCGIVIIMCNPTLSNFVLAGMLDIKKIVIWRTKEDLKNGPLTQFCEPAGLEIECGRKTDIKIQNKLKNVLYKFIKSYQKINIEKIIDNLKKKQLYVIYDKQNNKVDSLRDFKQFKTQNEIFYPFMSNVYPKIACYKMKKIKLEEIFLSLSKI
jgi:succinylglutamate desuccinylase